jgi:hypothetical protein
MSRTLKICLLACSSVLVFHASPVAATTPTYALIAKVTETECDSRSPDYVNGMAFGNCVHLAYLDPVSSRRYWVAPGGQIYFQFYVELSEQNRSGGAVNGPLGPGLHANFNITVTATDVESPTSVATNSATVTLYGSASAAAPAGANQLDGWTQLQANPGQTAFAFVNIPVNVDWAESYVTFSVTSTQFAGNQNQSVATEGDNCVSGPLACAGTWTDDGTYSAPSLANVNPNVVLNGLVPQPGDFVLVTIPSAAAQLAVMPLAILYAPVGNKGSSSFTVTLSTGSNITVGTQTATMASTTNTTDDKISYGGTLSLSGLIAALTGGGVPVNASLQYQGSQDWQTAVEKSNQNTFGSGNSIVSGVSLQNGYTNQDCFANTPPLPQVGYYTEPYWCDQIIVSVTSQFALWDYPAGPIVQPLGSLGIDTPTIQQLDTCANNDRPVPSNPPTPASLAADPILASHYLEVPSPTAAQTLYTWLSSSDCAALANLDPFYAQKTQAAFPSSYVTLPDGDTGVNTQTGQSFQDTTMWMVSATGSSQVQTTSQVTGTASTSNGFTANEGIGTTSNNSILQGTMGVTDTTSVAHSQSTTLTVNAQNTYTYSTQVQGSVSILDTSGITVPIDVVQDAIFQGLAPRDTDMTYSKPPILIPYRCTPWPLCVLHHLHGTPRIEKSNNAALTAKTMADFRTAAKRHIGRPVPPPPAGGLLKTTPPEILAHLKQLGAKDPDIADMVKKVGARQ